MALPANKKNVSLAGLFLCLNKHVPSRLAGLEGFSMRIRYALNFRRPLGNSGRAWCSGLQSAAHRFSNR